MRTLVGHQAPNFQAKAAVQEQIIDFSLSSFLGKNILLFFYPLDFTFVCPTELHAFQEKLDDFRARNAEVVAISVDSVYSHLAWIKTPRNKGGIEGVEYPIVADITKSIARSYGVLNEEEGIAYRGLFLIDSKGFIRHMVVNDLFVGRSVDEALRTLDALIYHEAHGHVCPANWKSGEKSLSPTQEGLEAYFSS